MINSYHEKKIGGGTKPFHPTGLPLECAPDERERGERSFDE